MAARIVDIAGKKFGRLTAIEIADRQKHYELRWRCRCDCGRETLVRSVKLRSGDIRSCGCSRRRELPPDWINPKSKDLGPLTLRAGHIASDQRSYEIIKGIIG